MTAADARLSPCPGELAAWLLEPSARSGPLGEILTGGEHRELFREYFRSRRRGQLVLSSLPGDGRETALVFAAEIDTAPFVDWYAGQHADAPKSGKFRKQAAETAGFLLDAWGPREHPAEETVYSCSPHGVEMLGRLIRDDYLPKEGNDVVALLPDWVQWCADRTGLPAALAAPALEAARAEAAKSSQKPHPPHARHAGPAHGNCARGRIHPPTTQVIDCMGVNRPTCAERRSDVVSSGNSSARRSARFVPLPGADSAVLRAMYRVTCGSCAGAADQDGCPHGVSLRWCTG
jgi:hypothetical protein